MSGAVKSNSKELERLSLFEAPDAERVIENGKGLVEKLARRLARQGALSVEDLVCEGNLGLLKAARRYKQSKGAKFSTYACYWVRQSMLRALDNKSRTVRIPWQAAAKLKRLESARLAFAGEKGRNPQESELAEAAGMSRRTARALLGSCRSALSLDSFSACGSDAPQTPSFELAPDTAPNPYELLAEKDELDFFRQALSSLDRREARALRLRFGIGGADGRRASCAGAGAKMGLSHEGVRKMQARALLKLRAMAAPELSGEAPEAIAV